MAWIFRVVTRLPAITRITAHLPEQLHNPYIFVQLLSSFVALFGAVAFTRGSLRELTDASSFSRWAALIVVFMAYFNLVLIYGPSFTLPYDVPSLFFFSGCLYCLIRRNYLAFYLLFTLGALNRETICFITLLFVIWQRSPSQPDWLPAKWSKIAPHVVAQGLIWLVIKVHLARHFASNPQENVSSGLFVPHLRYNLHEIIKPQQWPLLLSNFGFTLPLLISQRRWIQQAAITRMCAIAMPLWLILMLYVGVIIEIRIFTELITIVSIAIGLILFHRLQHLRSGSSFEIASSHQEDTTWL